MSIETLTAVRDVTILNGVAGPDRYGDTILDWDAPTELATTGWFAQTQTVETVDHRDVLVNRSMLTLRRDTPITPQSRVVIDGITYDVDGEPNPAWTPRGRHHWEVPLRQVAG